VSIDATPDWTEQFNDVAPLIAFMAKRFGLDAVREMLALGIEAESPMTREFLERAADQLSQVGLGKVARAVLEAAQDAPTEAEGCPYPPDSINGRSWLASLRRRQQRAQKPRQPV
jgi:hypothetical protein